MNARRGAAGAVAAVLGILFTIFTASPAAAAPAGSFDTPGEREKVASSDVRFAGRFTADNGGRLEGDIVLEVAGQPPQRQAVTSPADQPFNFTAKILRNGEYKAVASVLYRDWPYQLNEPFPHRIERTVIVEAPPAPVQGVTTRVNESERTVTVRWKANAEPDLVGYVVSRSYNKGAFVAVKAVEKDDLTYVDQLTADNPAGSYRYQVQAVRTAAKSEDPPLASSNGYSQATTVKSSPAAGSTTPTTGSTGGAGGGAAQSGGAAKAAAPVGANGRVDMAKFNNLLGQPSLGAAPNESAPLLSQADLAEEAEDEGGFSDRLPYGPDGIPGTADDGEGDMELGVDEASSSDERPTTLLSLGGAALAAMLVALTRWILNEVKRSEEDLAPVEPDAADAAMAELVEFMPSPVVEEAPAPVRRERPLRSPMRPQRDLVGTAQK